MMYQFRLTPSGWQVTRPQQEQHRAYVGYQNSDAAGVILDLRSHHTMPAYFSPTDDRDEQEGRLWGTGPAGAAQPSTGAAIGHVRPVVTNVPALTPFEGARLPGGNLCRDL
ncbi:MAG: hypothetical protein U0401_20220 [Anaerolineae bacterium]